jgi:hypothetical protein
MLRHGTDRGKPPPGVLVWPGEWAVTPSVTRHRDAMAPQGTANRAGHQFEEDMS